MRITVRQLKRIIKEAVSAEKRAAYNQRRREKAAAERQTAEQERIRKLNMSPDKQKKLAEFLADLHFEFGHTFGDEGGEMSWDEVMDYASNMGVRTTPDELERVMLYSDMFDDSLGYIMGPTKSGIFFEDPLSL